MSTTQAFPAKSHAPIRLAHFTWAVLAYNVAVVLWGAVVRATSSGNGCGDHWPLCNGVVLQTNPRLATWIELAHRMTSGVTVFLVLALVVWTFRATVRGHLARITAIAAVVLTLNEALLGALLVLLRLTADNRSPARGVYLSLHLANTLLLLAALALSAHFLARTDGFARNQVRVTSLPLFVAGLVATLTVGVSGSLAALGDTLYPATSLAAAWAQDFSSGSNWLIRLRLLHPALSLVAGGFICWLLLRSIRQPAERRISIAVVVLLALQYALGVADVFLLAPVWMQILHLLGADLLWITLVVLAARVCVRSRALSRA